MSEKAVLFDIGSTLIAGPDISPAKHISRLLGLPDREKGRVADLLMCTDFTCHRHVCRELAGKFTVPDDLEKHMESLWREQEISAGEIAGASRAVGWVKSLGFKVGLVSDIWAPYHRAFLRACPEAAAMVDYAALSFREGIKKPCREIFLRALDGLGVSPENAWMVGDTYENDLAPAMRLGIKTVWVLCRPEKEYPAMSGVLTGSLKRPDIMISSIAQLPETNLE
ncbi:2-haloalkanoic acid dehalogenase [Desulfocucumis palustris]|uniref:2-haloalkanoic acid dehalogenase n=1 Tax=Desulfocucumis palustris TaxID=1898651 RepID=A0A2L2XMS7_9FIRM|nr:HAD family hydrolase [Desulfocucumis palustris]GBF35646.1 2-haloalkanoic acid dehalogenase [Desulfocucumis palustris]